MSTKLDLEQTAATLRSAGCLAPREEAGLLLRAVDEAGLPTAADRAARLGELVRRRCAGEPLVWLLGQARFCGETVRVGPGVYVPRPQSEALALAALSRLPERGLAVDLCTGSGALAVVLQRRRPSARVWATEIDPGAAACARSNGVRVCEGDMAAGLPPELRGRVDVVTAVVPYVPTGELPLLPRDVVAYEPRRALDGGHDGTRLLRRAAREAALLLRPGGSLVLELGGNEAELLRPLLAEQGYRDVELLLDAEGDPRGLVCRHAERR